ncbi:MAG TPA: cobamide remodeling phosphodiesterase CbiR [Polyangiales bacterium]|nr:cobamide remodeling phosphodiesterase CbiR [Polyangiales bacterium]
MPPFRTGATSFVYPASWAANVERLAGRVEDIELLFFAPQGPDGLPDPAELQRLVELRDRHALTYSIHTPLSASLASEDDARRAAGVAEVLRVVDATRCLSPSAYVLHVYWGDAEHGPRPSDDEAFRQRAARSLRQIIAHGLAPELLCVEYLDYDLDLLAPVIEGLELSVALDVGHLLRDGRDWAAILARYLPRTRLVQWHGTQPGGRDHQSLEHVPREVARALVEQLTAANWDGVLTLEVFEEQAFERSLALLSQLQQEITCRA